MFKESAGLSKEREEKSGLYGSAVQPAVPSVNTHLVTLCRTVGNEVRGLRESNKGAAAADYDTRLQCSCWRRRQPLGAGGRLEGVAAIGHLSHPY